ncbi:hypothetical protein C5Z25_11660 [Lactobacillus sp. CBA3605]|uniref:MFS transporter n=1 Tax=Lactobacillus sp. CBA3605 TaxID=2099788 RepID=UPI000CFABAAF|nr:MFS transporter [Lactobacillus sp. CBA3605]AVK62372.1 hypothetical protein C5Z25_11660 [Lactobacillus sp. CBA3605]
MFLKNEVLLISTEYKIITSKTVSFIGTLGFNAVLNIWILHYFHSSAILGNANAYIGASAFICSIVGGYIADGKHLKSALLISDLIACLVCVISAVTQAFKELQIMYVIVFLLNINVYLNSPLFKTLSGHLIAKDQLVKFNVKLSFLIQLVTIIIPPIFTSLYSASLLSFQTVLFVNAASFFISFICVYQLPKIHNKKKGINYQKALSNILKYRVLLLLIITGGLLNLILSGFNILSPIYATQTLHNSNLYGYFLAFESVGGILGILSIKWIKLSDNILFERWSLVFSALSLLLIIFFKSTLLFIFSISILSMSISRYNVSVQSFIQKKVALVQLGKVFSISFMFANLGTIIGSYLFGQLFTLSLPAAIITICLGLVLIDLVWLAKE